MKNRGWIMKVDDPNHKCSIHCDVHTRRIHALGPYVYIDKKKKWIPECLCVFVENQGWFSKYDVPNHKCSIHCDVHTRRIHALGPHVYINKRNKWIPEHMCVFVENKGWILKTPNTNHPQRRDE